MAVTKKTETKATAKTAVKAAPAETAAKKTAVVKEEAPAVKAAPVEKAAPAKKAPAKKAAEPKSSVVIEFAGKQIVAKEVLAAAKKAFTKANKGVTIKTIEIYVKPEENVAYYVVNGQGSDDYKIEL